MYTCRSCGKQGREVQFTDFLDPEGAPLCRCGSRDIAPIQVAEYGDGWTYETHLPAASVAKRPGWTPALVTQLLGQPDLRGPNPHRGVPMKLYSIERIEKAEAGKVFQGRLAKYVASLTPAQKKAIAQVSASVATKNSVKAAPMPAVRLEEFFRQVSARYPTERPSECTHGPNGSCGYTHADYHEGVQLRFIVERRCDGTRRRWGLVGGEFTSEREASEFARSEEPRVRASVN